MIPLDRSRTHVLRFVVPAFAVDIPFRSCRLCRLRWLCPVSYTVLLCGCLLPHRTRLLRYGSRFPRFAYVCSHHTAVPHAVIVSTRFCVSTLRDFAAYCGCGWFFFNSGLYTWLFFTITFRFTGLVTFVPHTVLHLPRSACLPHDRWFGCYLPFALHLRAVVGCLRITLLPGSFYAHVPPLVDALRTQVTTHTPGCYAHVLPHRSPFCGYYALRFLCVLPTFVTPAHATVCLRLHLHLRLCGYSTATATRYIRPALRARFTYPFTRIPLHTRTAHAHRRFAAATRFCLGPIL